ncbi:EpsG family protein [Fusobacterium animalis]|uniref:EpsG family protein n=1 Tax=Fusobacterium animalis TaxID=76859 RepID=UPI0030CF022A
MFYIYLSIYFFFGSIKDEILKKNKSKFLIFLLIFLFCFTYQMGTDWLSYQNYYENIFVNTDWEDLLLKNARIERGYVLLNIFFYKLGFNYEIFSGLVLSVCTYITLKYIQEKSKNKYLAFYVFFIYMFNAALLEPLMRQVIALTIFIVSLKYLEKKKFLKYVFFIFLAAQFHRTAYLLLPLYFINYIKFSVKKVIVIILLFKLLLNTMIDIVIYIFPKYMEYLTAKRYAPKELTITTIIMCIYHIFIIFYIYKNSDKKKNYILKFACIYVILSSIVVYFPIINRLNLYFAPFIAISLSYVTEFYFLNKKISESIEKKLVVIISIFFISATMFYRRITVGGDLVSLAYLNYKNYIIEFIKGDLKNDFSEKKSFYENQVKKIMEKEDQE